MRSGLPTGGLPRCREVGSIQQVIYISFHGHEVGFTDRWFSTMSWGRVYPMVYDGFMVRYIVGF